MPHPAIVAKYDRAARGLRAAWRAGTTEWLRENAVGKLLDIEVKQGLLDETWKRAEVSACTEAEFDAALESWRAACAVAIEEFAKSEER